MVFVGDSVTEGYFATTLEQHGNFSNDFLLTDNKLGFANGQVNSFESLLRGLLQENNRTMKYAFMNYALGGGRLSNPYGEPVGKYFKDSCRHEQLTKSLPHLVFIGFGYLDQLQPNFTAEKYTDTLLAYIQEVKNLPSKPIVMLMVPVADRQMLFHGRECISNQNDARFPAFTKDGCYIDQRLDLMSTYYKVAKMTGIPDHHVINAFSLLRLNPDVAASKYFNEDGVHPNKVGMGVIAQDIFMKMTLSPEIQERQWSQKNGLDEVWNEAVRAQIKSH